MSEGPEGQVRHGEREKHRHRRGGFHHIRNGLCPHRPEVKALKDFPGLLQHGVDELRGLSTWLLGSHELDLHGVSVISGRFGGARSVL